MPKIPIYQPDQRVLPDAPPSAELAPQNQGFAGLQQFGSGLGQIGYAVAKSVKDSEDRNYAENRAVRDSLAILEFQEKLKNTIPAGAPGYTEEVSRFTKTLFEDGQAEAPSEQARNLYMPKALRNTESFVMSAKKYEVEKNLENQRVESLKSDDLINKSVAAGAGKKFALDNQVLRLAAIDKEVQDGLFSAQEGEERKRKFLKGWSDSYYDYLLSRNTNAARISARTELELGNKSRINDGFSGHELGVWLNKFSLQADYARRTNLSLLGITKDVNKQSSTVGAMTEAQLREQLNLARSVHGNNPGALLAESMDAYLKYEVSNAIAGLNASNAPEDYDKVMDGLGARVKDSLIREFLTNPKIVEMIQSKSFEDFLQKSAGDRIKSQVDSRKTAIKEDPAQSVQGNANVKESKARIQAGEPGATQKYYFHLKQAMDAEKIDPSEQLILRRGEASALAQEFNRAKTGKDKADLIARIEAEAGVYSPEVFKALEKFEPSVSNIALVSYIGDPVVREKVLELFSRETENAIKGAQDNIALPDKMAIRDTVNSLFRGPINQAFKDARGSAFTSLKDDVGIKKLISDYATVLLPEKRSGGAAAMEAFQIIVNKQFVPLKSNGNFFSNGHYVLFRKYSGGQEINQSAVEEFIAQSLKPEKLSTLGIIVPVNTSKDEYYKMIGDKGYWKTSSDLLRIELWYDDEKDMPHPVEWAPGRGLSIPFTTISRSVK